MRKENKDKNCQSVKHEKQITCMIDNTYVTVRIIGQPYIHVYRLYSLSISKNIVILIFEMLITHQIFLLLHFLSIFAIQNCNGNRKISLKILRQKTRLQI